MTLLLCVLLGVSACAYRHSRGPMCGGTGDVTLYSLAVLEKPTVHIKCPNGVDVTFSSQSDATEIAQALKALKKKAAGDE